MGLSYEDFSLRMMPAPDGPGYIVRVHCEAGEGEGRFVVPSDDGMGLETLLQEARQARDLGPTALRSLPRRARQLGEDLFRALFTGEVGRLFDRCRGASMSPGRGLRIRLHFPSNLAELLDLPWELLCCPDTQDQFGLDRLRPVVRYLEMPRSAQAVPVEPPLRVLLAAANPSRTFSLDLSQEIDFVRKALFSIKAEIVEIEHASLGAVREALRHTAFHVFHFMGHGTFDGQTGSGSLLFETPEGLVEGVTGESLARHIYDSPPPLVVLSACHSGRSGANVGRDPFGGVAAALVRGGLPAVVAMRAPVADRAAIAFSKALYTEIALGEPVEAAVAEGRLAIYRMDPLSPEWATPVLFLRAVRGLAAAPVEEISPEAPLPQEQSDVIIFDRESRIQAENADIVNERDSGSGSSEIRNNGLIDVRGHLTIANRKGGRPRLG